LRETCGRRVWGAAGLCALVDSESEEARKMLRRVAGDEWDRQGLRGVDGKAVMARAGGREAAGSLRCPWKAGSGGLHPVQL
jgi:hypothetical protein